MAPALLTVLYPRQSSGETKFDMKYYLATHLPLCERAWNSHGLQSWTVSSFAEGPYVVQAMCRFADMKGMQTGLAEGMEQTGGDIKNYTDVTPTVLMSTLEGEK